MDIMESNLTLLLLTVTPLILVIVLLLLRQLTPLLHPASRRNWFAKINLVLTKLRTSLGVGLQHDLSTRIISKHKSLLQTQSILYGLIFGSIIALLVGCLGLSLNVFNQTGRNNPWRNAVEKQSAFFPKLLNPFQNYNQYDSKVWFIMSTTYAMKMQEPKLVRIAQALYPSREFIIWVIVSDGQKVTDQLDYLKHLDSIINRFSIPYVLLSTALPGFNVENVFGSNYFGIFSKPEPELIAVQLGLLWCLEHAGNGVMMIGNEDFTYHYQLFSEIRNIKKVSIWPVELRENHVRIKDSFAQFKDSETGLQNCHVGIDYYQITFSSIAVNLQYLKNNLPIENIRNLGTDLQNDVFSLGVPASDVEPLKECDKIYVWATKQFTKRSVKWKLEPIHRNSNVEFLLKYIYREQFNKYFYYEQDKSTIIKPKKSSRSRNYNSVL